jgi:hypothetical protein
MRKGLLVAAVCVAVSGVAASGLEAQSLVRVNLGAGPTFPIGDDKGTGVHANLGLGIGIPMLPFGVRVEGMVQRIPEGDDHHDYLGGSVNAEVALPLPLARPFLIGGVGLVRHEEHHGNHTHGAHTDFAFNVGVGAEVGLFGLSGYVEARYHRLLNGDDHGHGHSHDDHKGNTFIPITFGIRF